MISGFPDAYELRARIAPILLVFSPILIHFSGMSVLEEDWLGASLYGIFGLAVLTLLAQFARDPGKRIEVKLFKEWGGPPTTQLLRHSNNKLDAHVKARVLNMCRTRIDSFEPPTLDDERSNEAHADALYASAVHWLRAQTSDKEKFHRLREENISYGFRRNFLGLKPLGLLVALMSLLLASYYSNPVTAEGLAKLIRLPGFWVGLVSALTLLISVRPSWVKLAAFNYAYALMNAGDALANDKSSD